MSVLSSLPLPLSLLLSLPPSLLSVFKNYFILGVWVFCLLYVCEPLACRWISWNWSCKRLCTAENQTIVPWKNNQCHLSNLTFVFFWDKFSPWIQNRPASNSISSCLCCMSAGILACTTISGSAHTLLCIGPKRASVSCDALVLRVHQYLCRWALHSYESALWQHSVWPTSSVLIGPVVLGMPFITNKQKV